MLEGFLAFGRKKLNRLKDANVEALETPLKIEKPIYGEKIQKFKTFAASGLIALVLSLLSLILTTLTFVEDRQDGLWERDLVAGVRPYQLFVAHCVVQVMLLVIQVILALICMYCIFAIPCRGSAVLLVTLSILQGFLGVTFGTFYTNKRNNFELRKFFRFLDVGLLPSNKNRTNDFTWLLFSINDLKRSSVAS